MVTCRRCGLFVGSRTSGAAFFIDIDCCCRNGALDTLTAGQHASRVPRISFSR